MQPRQREVKICTSSCGEIVGERLPNGYWLSQYMDKDGRCFECAFAKRLKNSHDHPRRRP